jgi:hypothetical protein
MCRHSRVWTATIPVSAGTRLTGTLQTVVLSESQTKLVMHEACRALVTSHAPADEYHPAHAGSYRLAQRDRERERLVPNFS